MEEKKFKLEGKEYVVKKFFYKPDRVKQIKFYRKYLNYEKEYVGQELHDKFYQSIHKIKLIKDVTQSIVPIDKEILKEQINENLISEDLYQEFFQKQTEAIQLFLFENEENSKELCEIHFTNADEIDHNPIEDNSFLDYNSFILELFQYFFFDKKK